MQSTVESVQEQATNIFGQTTQHTDASRTLLSKHQENNFLNRLKSRQQLEVSHDSPFNRNESQLSEELQSKRLKEDRARYLRDETEEIKRQLQLVRERLEELKASNESSLRPPSARLPLVPEAKDGYSNKSNSDPIAIEAPSKRAEALDSNATQPTAPAPAKRASLLKLRPLTGKVDCPNCACDRRTSVCDVCIRFVNVRPQAVPPNQVNRGRSVAATPTGGSQQPEPAPGKTSPSEAHKDETAQDRAGKDDSTAAKSVSRSPSEMQTPTRAESMGSLLRESVAPTNRPQPIIDQTFRAKEMTVDDSIVPGRLYTIGKSLNDKRSRLAQAIEELQTMMDRVRRREERLEQERKVVQLYKSQWRFGPAVGGPAGSARARLGKQTAQRQPTYQSRLDSNLQRDSRAVMGFQRQPQTRQSTPDLQSSLYQANRTRAAANNQAPWRRRPSGQPNGASETLSNKSRSKSLESLRQPARPPSRAATTELGRANSSSNKAQVAKASSDTNLERSSSPEDIKEELEEEIRDDDDNIDVDSQTHAESEKNGSEIQSTSHGSETRGDERQSRTDNQRNGSLEEVGERTPTSNEQRERDRVKTWVPVFGETEIKTVKKIRPSRKMQVLHSVSHQQTTNTFQYSGNNRSGSRQMSTYNHSYGSPNSSGPMRRSTTFVRSKSNLESSRPLTARHQPPAKCKLPNPTLVEARKRIHFASDLLDGEQRDSKTSNQIIINKRVSAPTPKPRRHLAPTGRLPPAKLPKPPNSSQVNNSNSVGGEQDRLAQHLIQDASGELLKLEQMIAEQHKLLAKMAAERSPGASRCLSPCCQTATSTSSLCSSSCCQQQQQQQQQQTQLKTVTVMDNSGGSSPITTGSAGPRPSRASPLVNHLKDKLNKTKTRLARTLEEERRKHEQLKLRIDSSLRKQSDLENENELLKRSLNKCIDTCLRDISNTFESISDTLNNSFNVDSDTKASVADEDGNLLTAFSSAAQLIEDNRHLKKMKSVIETAESQRKRIFDELKEEKQRSNLLEAQLEQNRLELNELIETKRRLENQLAPSGELSDQNAADQLRAASDTTNGDCERTEVHTLDDNMLEEQTATAKQAAADASQQQLKPACSWQQTTPDLDSQACDTTNANSSTMTEDSSTFTSVDAYRQYIQTMSPDLEAIRRERKMILSEFDNIKKMLSEMDN